MKKIYVNKTDTAPSVIERVISAEDKEITLYIPRGTQFSTLKNNFSLLKREAGHAGKLVTIESVDDTALDLAASVGLNAVNPFFGRKMRAVSDIVLKSEITEQTQPKSTHRYKNYVAHDDKSQDLKEEADFGIEELNREPRSRLQRVISLLLITILFVGVGVGLAIILPRADINLTFKETPFEFDGSFVADTNAKTPTLSSAQVIVPGTVFKDVQNYSMACPASDKKNVEQKATGKITIYNAYGSSSQLLVKGTRFTTPDGKVFRLDANVTVPGAKVSGGKLTPSSIAATVAADKPGPDYNVGPVSRFRIPGFQNTPKYEGFYAESKDPMTGGFIGNVAVPSMDDIAKTKSAVEAALTDALNSQAILKLPQNVKTLAGSSQVAMTSENICKTVNPDGSFTATAYGEIKVMTFLESDLISVMAAKVADTSSLNLILKGTPEITYGSAPALDFAKGQMSTSIAFKSYWVQPFDLNGFKSRAANKNETELKTLIFSLPGIKSGEVKLWPFWVTKVPGDASKIRVDVVYEP